MTQPLEGLKVIDLSRILAGPLCTMTLADFGAEVLKVESEQGDETRGWVPPITADGVSTYYSAVNRNKKSVVVDFRAQNDLEALKDRIHEADVVVENFRPGVLDKFGLDYASLSQANTALVYCSISGFGDQAGAHLPGFDLLIQALGGLMSITGKPEGEPSKVGVALVDVLAAQNATSGILLALRERDASGQGQHVKISLLTSVLAGLSNQSASTVATGISPRRMGNAHPSIAPYETFATAAGVLAVGVGNDRQFASFLDQLGLEEVKGDPRFTTNALRVKHREELRMLLEPALVARSAAQWQENLMAAGVPAGKVNTIAEAIELAETLGLDPVATIEDAENGRTSKHITSPITLSRTGATYTRVPPTLGEHQELLSSSSTHHQGATP